jgi:hypothetical protein
MDNKRLLLAAAIFSIAAFASSKTYTVVITQPMHVGTAQLAPGNYKMALDGDKAVFNLPNHDSLTFPVKVETATHKYADTIVDSAQQGGSLHLVSIALGGSTNKVDFDK